MVTSIGILELMNSCVVIDFFGFLFAYLDPGAGSVVLQILVAGFLSMLVVLRAYWHSIADFFRSILGIKKPSETNSEKDSADIGEQAVDNVDKKAA